MDTINEIGNEPNNVFDEFETEQYSPSAGKGKRFLNLIIDAFFFYVFIIVITVVVSLFIAFVAPGLIGLLQGGDSNIMIEYLIGFVCGTVFHSTMEFFTGGRSVGKYLTKTKVVTLEGGKPTFKTCLIRSMCRYIPFEPFSFFGSNDGGWHDSISDTRVIELVG